MNSCGNSLQTTSSVQDKPTRHIEEITGPQPNELKGQSLIAFKSGSCCHVIESGLASEASFENIETEELLGQNSRPLVKALMSRGVSISASVWDLALAGKMLSKDANALANEIRRFESSPDPEETFKALTSLRHRVRRSLETEGQLETLERIEIPLLQILAEMEAEGIRCDKAKSQPSPRFERESVGLTL